MNWLSIGGAAIAGTVTALVMHYFVGVQGQAVVPRETSGLSTTQLSVDQVARCRQTSICTDIFSQTVDGKVYGWPWQSRVVYSVEGHQKTFESPVGIVRNAAVLSVLYLAVFFVAAKVIAYTRRA